jgi:chemotaxis protein MotB
VGGYFRDPTGTSKLVGNGQNGSGENLTLTRDNMSQLKDELQNAIRKTANFEKIKDHIEMTITAEGLRVELMESGTGDNFFQRGVAVPTDSGKDILVKLAEELGKLPNLISIEGHTDSKPFATGRGYGNWELSADRANAARRIMQDAGVRPVQVSQMRGFADRRPRDSRGPEDDSNRRVTVIVQYQVKDGETPPASGEEPAKAETPPAHH